jgi:hypothetical protein
MEDCITIRENQYELHLDKMMLYLDGGNQDTILEKTIGLAVDAEKHEIVIIHADILQIKLSDIQHLPFLCRLSSTIQDQFPRENKKTIVYIHNLHWIFQSPFEIIRRLFVRDNIEFKAGQGTYGSPATPPLREQGFIREK